MSEIILGRLSGEVTLKSRGVIRSWLNLLVKQIERRLQRKNLKASIQILELRVIVEPKEDSNIELIADSVAKTFGIKEVIIAKKVPLNIDDIISASREVVSNFSGTFAVRTHRAYKGFPVTSIELNKIIGEVLVRENKNLKVDLKNPDLELRIEIRKDGAYVYRKKKEGPGGLPYSVSGRGIALISGGIDSSVAAWLAMKRGMKIIALHADMGEYYSDRARNRARAVLKWLADWVPSGKLKAYIVRVAKLHERVKLPSDEFRCVFCKMLLVKLAELVAKKESAHAIITGESLSQVASQTPQNIKIINLVTSYPILRPLIFMDKSEIDSIAQKIGLYNIVSIDVGSCLLLPRRPALKTDDRFATRLIEILYSLPLEETLERDAVVEFISSA
ncbi:MAG: tRNA uracil 4-sulfurtransferase ThiI [Candidatus Korarchaeota archaeon]|nr:tRNA 4-thiouridine(8) synthase ThiI [Thermoproteota archaeon]MCR8463372.1 tRNA 4-thiouridine(8) synthase ThiI [Thermoproteota archaeon]MCR8470415.1 tRNA 4-thiouridine(8) synthase ThiI [Thermoproteota archaeon]MCR8471432.1 tRNA 4-thiouridine(8) synthase ThiI [Thermoproteota archaeon]MCR8473275.1 tRNA 4-thiouridine(8) synthase ThiI [Thermoproteota archaeon]